MSTARGIVTSYLTHDYQIIRKNYSTNANRAVQHAVGHMQENDYGATVAEVYDEYDGTLHAQLVFDLVGDMRIAYKRDPKAYARKMALTPLIELEKRK